MADVEKFKEKIVKGAKEQGVDVVLKGEAENSFIGLLEHLEKKQKLDDIPGIAFMKGKKVHSNEVGRLVEDFDSLPYPARDILYEKYPFMAK